MSQIGLAWTTDSEHCHAKVFEENGLFESVPPERLAIDAFAAVFRNNQITSLDSVARFHNQLLERFAFETFTIGREMQEPIRPFAVWVLLHCIHTIGQILQGQPTAKGAVSEREVDYSGLSISNIEAVSGLIEDSRRATVTLGSERRNMRHLGIFFKRLQILLSQDGLASWIACRCTTILMSYLEMPISETQGHLRFERRLDKFRNQHWLDARRLTTRLFRAALQMTQTELVILPRQKSSNSDCTRLFRAMCF